MKKRVVVVTDGDSIAQKAVREACENTGLYPVMSSGGNPTPLTGSELAEQIKSAPFDPVVVMLDDKGEIGTGPGEMALEYLLNDKELEILGVVAVASNTDALRGVNVDESIDLNGRIISEPVDKNGESEPYGNIYLEGDTSEILARYPDVRVIGCGDLGKMMGHDRPEKGAHITTKCIQQIIDEHNGVQKQ
ncbi:MAG: stage V sporulation protein AE [Candidatus Saccharibacteria bacterium]